MTTKNTENKRTSAEETIRKLMNLDEIEGVQERIAPELKHLLDVGASANAYLSWSIRDNYGLGRGGGHYIFLQMTENGSGIGVLAEQVHATLRGLSMHHHVDGVLRTALDAYEEAQEQEIHEAIYRWNKSSKCTTPTSPSLGVVLTGSLGRAPR